MGISKLIKNNLDEDVFTQSFYEEIYSSFLDLNYEKPTEYVIRYWNLFLKYCNERSQDKRLRKIRNEKIFQFILVTLFIRENILPFFIDTRVKYVPEPIPLLLLTSKGHCLISLYLTTSYKEFHKLADLEAMALKNVHRISKSFLIALSDDDALQVSQKIIKEDIFGLNDVIVATSEKFNQFISELKAFTFDLSPSVSVIECNQIITKENLDLLL